MNAIQALFNLAKQYEHYTTTRKFLYEIIGGVSSSAVLTHEQWMELEPRLIQATVGLKDDVERNRTDAANFAIHINQLAQNHKK